MARTPRTLALLLALALSGSALAQDLCVDGRAGITYGGLAPRHGSERDHCRPLGLGGADDAGNVRYEPLAEAGRTLAVRLASGCPMLRKY
jgi:hypothetical protein